MTTLKDLNSYTILSIDPGTNCTGVSILQINNDTKAVVILHSETIKAEKLALGYIFVMGIHGLRYAKILSVADRIDKLLRVYSPDLIVTESPYMGRFAQAFAALTELIAEIRNRVFLYNPNMVLNTVEPSIVKKNLGVKGTSGDKNAMREAILKYPLSYRSYIEPENLDEHAIDSIAVGLCFSNNINSFNYGI